jgi:hypothetical protein
MKNDICTFIEKCDTCQRNNGEMVKPLGALQPLSIYAMIWNEISMDFIVGIPKVGNKLVIIMVFNFLSKYVHFCALATPLQS